MRIRAKICGITRTQDAALAAELGADALGFVFYPDSPRAVSTSQAADLSQAVPPFVTRVGLFVNPTADLVETVLTRVGIDLLQFHGDESPAFCAAFGRPYIKALRVRADTDLTAAAERYADAAGLLLDAHVDGLFGGTGHSFDWSLWPAQVGRPLILAGGLNPENVATAVRQTRPYAVDVSGGVEGPHKGIKDAGRLRAFMQALAEVDGHA